MPGQQQSWWASSGGPGPARADVVGNHPCGLTAACVKPLAVFRARAVTRSDSFATVWERRPSPPPQRNRQNGTGAGDRVGTVVWQPVTGQFAEGRASCAMSSYLVIQGEERHMESLDQAPSASGSSAPNLGQQRAGAGENLFQRVRAMVASAGARRHRSHQVWIIQHHGKWSPSPVLGRRSSYGVRQQRAEGTRHSLRIRLSRRAAAIPHGADVVIPAASWR